VQALAGHAAVFREFVRLAELNHEATSGKGKFCKSWDAQRLGFYEYPLQRRSVVVLSAFLGGRTYEKRDKAAGGTTGQTGLAASVERD